MRRSHGNREDSEFSGKHDKQFFYVHQAADTYDVTIDLIVPHYTLIQETIIRTMTAVLETRGQSTILDVGSGTGSISLPLLAAFPRSFVVSMDLSAAMQLQHQHKLDAMPIHMQNRNILIQANILERGTPLLELLPPELRVRGFDAVVSGFTVHHFSHTQKIDFYSRMSGILATNGVLLNADLFSYADSEISASALNFDLSWIRRNLASPPPHTKEAQELSTDRRAQLIALWIRHYEEDNVLEPIESPEGSVGQAEMLKLAGMPIVSVPYRFSLSGILLGRKGCTSRVIA